VGATELGGVLPARSIGLAGLPSSGARDPDVELLWWTPGNWDCYGKDAVLALLAERVNQGTPAEVEITEVNDTTLLVERRDTVLEGPEAGLRPATLLRLRNRPRCAHAAVPQPRRRPH
jgi:hypothetical protein